MVKKQYLIIKVIPSKKTKAAPVPIRKKKNNYHTRKQKNF